MMETVGHPRAVNALRRGLEEGRLSHAYLIAGPAHVGKMTLAMDLARMVNCAADAPPCGECRHCERIRQGLHADVRVVGPGYGGDEAAQSKSSIGIGEVRALGREANLKPFEGGTRVFIVEDAERLTPEAANALLKTLEEPPDQVVLALLASEPSVLPPTVLSRCRQIALRPMPVEQVAQELRSRNGADAMRIEEIARLSGGRMGWALRAVQEPELVDGRTKRLQEVQEVLEGTLEKRFAYAARLASRFAKRPGVSRRGARPVAFLAKGRLPAQGRPGRPHNQPFDNGCSAIGRVRAVSGSGCRCGSRRRRDAGLFEAQRQPTAGAGAAHAPVAPAIEKSVE